MLARANSSPYEKTAQLSLRLAPCTNLLPVVYVFFKTDRFSVFSEIFPILMVPSTFRVLFFMIVWYGIITELYVIKKHWNNHCKNNYCDDDSGNNSFSFLIVKIEHFSLP